MSAHCCMYCLEDISRYNLDFKRDIVCHECIQRLVPYRKYTRRGSKRVATARKVRDVGSGKGKKPPTGVGG